MNELIILSGDASCGKTTTLKMLIAMLLNQPNTFVDQINPSSVFSRIKLIQTAYSAGGSLPAGDISVVLNVQGVLVGIRTEGDTIGSVWNGVVFFEKKGCSIGVLAAHPEHLKRSQPCLTTGWTHTSMMPKRKVAVSGQQYAANQATAKVLLNNIMTTVGNLCAASVSSQQSIPSHP